MDSALKTTELASTLREIDSTSDSYATEFVDSLLTASHALQVSDVHLQPTARGLNIRWRMDGVLQPIGTFSPGTTADPIARLKVLAELLTYRTDVPQEGRIRDCPQGIEMRVSTFPGLRGERAVIRLFHSTVQAWTVEDLGFPGSIHTQWQQELQETSGALIVSGPAGSGKTTTAYASLREIAKTSAGGRSIVSLEDPIEVEVDGVAQAQVNAASDLTMTSGLRSLLRQDPEVLFIGEIRDAEAAAISFQAALTGQLALTTFHTHSAAAVISRLSDMGLENYVLRSGIRAILNQRLVRRLCECKQPVDHSNEHFGWTTPKAWQATGCECCSGTGYRGRALIVEYMQPQRLDRDLLERCDAAEIESACVAAGMRTRWEAAEDAITSGLTSPKEARRVLGFRQQGRPTK